MKLALRGIGQRRNRNARVRPRQRLVVGAVVVALDDNRRDHRARGWSGQREDEKGSDAEAILLHLETARPVVMPPARRAPRRTGCAGRSPVTAYRGASCDLMYPATSSAAAIYEGTLTTMKTIDANRGPAAYFNVDRSILANHRHGVPYTP